MNEFPTHTPATGDPGKTEEKKEIVVPIEKFILPEKIKIQPSKAKSEEESSSN